MARRPSRIERFDQVERYLASGMSASEWCELNHVSRPTLYRWLDTYAEAEGLDPAALRPKRAKTEWVELARADAKRAVALAVAENRPETPAEAPCPAGGAPAVIEVAGARVAVAASTDPAALMLALRALAALRAPSRRRPA